MFVSWVLVSSVDVECWCYQEVYLGHGGRCGRNPTLAVGVHVDPQRPKPVAYNVQSPDCQLQETSCTCKHLTQTCWVDWRCKRLRGILEPNKISIPIAAHTSKFNSDVFHQQRLKQHIASAITGTLRCG